VRLCVLRILLLVLSALAGANAQSYLGFDRNDYPGDANLTILAQTYSYAGYWLNNPPGAKTNTWAGKRQALESAGFGFLVLFNGRLYKELKHDASATGVADGRAAVGAARREGFPQRTIIFLDVEEGGRMLAEQKAYIFAWVDAVTAAGFRAGVYCSGIPAKEGKTSVVTAEDIRQNAQERHISFWVTNDACPPSAGCAFSPSVPSQSGVGFADVWQFAQSPRRKDFAAQCHNYNSDGNCYPPRVDPASRLHVDVDTATSADPSRGR
jgi:hypothetical protein